MLGEPTSQVPLGAAKIQQVAVSTRGELRMDGAEDGHFYLAKPIASCSYMSSYADSIP